MAASSPKTAGQSNFTIQLHCVRLRDHFETEGVCHSIRCIGCGSAEGLGLRVRVRLEAGRFSGCLALISSTVICGGFLQELESAPTRAPPTPASPTQETDSCVLPPSHIHPPKSCMGGKRMPSSNCTSSFDSCPAPLLDAWNLAINSRLTFPACPFRCHAVDIQTKFGRSVARRHVLCAEDRPLA